MAKSEGEVRPANDEMVLGYRDGYHLAVPEPSGNRTASYRHGFMVGRGDKTGGLEGTAFQSLSRAADAAMAEDDARAGGSPAIHAVPRYGLVKAAK